MNIVKYNILEWIGWCIFLRIRPSIIFRSLSYRRLCDAVFDIGDIWIKQKNNPIKLYCSKNKYIINSLRVKEYVNGLIELFVEYKLINNDKNNKFEIIIDLVENEEYWKDEQMHNILCREYFGINDKIYHEKYKRK